MKRIPLVLFYLSIVVLGIGQKASSSETPIKTVKRVFKDYIKNSESTDSQENKDSISKALKRLQVSSKEKDLSLLIEVWMYYDPTDFPTRGLIEPIFFKNKTSAHNATRMRILMRAKGEDKDSAPFSDLYDLRNRLSKASSIDVQSAEVKFLIDTTISIMKNNAVNAKSVDWDRVREDALAKAKDLTNPYQLGPTMRYLYKSINDFHGAFFYRDSVFQWRPKESKVSDSIMNEWKKGVQSITMVLDKNIGYLRIPSMPVASQNEFNTKAQRLNDSLCSLLNKNVKGIILDLRLNGGGAMHPMILGVEQLLMKGYIGSFRVKKKEDWFIRDNGFFVDTTLYSKITPRCNVDAQKIPIVILTSPHTGSSAECFIIAFKVRSNTVLLGSKTAGYTTVNTGMSINETAFMNLAVGYSADKNGKVYKEAIEPDIPFTSVDKFNNIPKDEKVKAAIKWLKLHIQ